MIKAHQIRAHTVMWEILFNTFVGGKQPKGQQHLFAFQIKPVLVKACISKWQIRNAMMDKDYFIFGYSIDIFEQVRSLPAHHHKFVGYFSEA